MTAPKGTLARRVAPASVLGTLLVASAVLGVLAPRGDAQDHGARAHAAAPAARGDHASITSGMDCSACHTPHGWSMGAGTSGRGFDHARTGFPLTGRHARTSCTQCHQAGVHVRAECVACHDDAHQSRLGRDCQRCHTSVRWTDVRPLEIHRSTRLPLTGRHAMIDCTECHRRTGNFEFSGIPADCFSCHEADYRQTSTHPDHTGAAGGTPFPRDCATCHQTNAWSPAFCVPGAGPMCVPTGTTAPLVDATDHEAYFPLRVGPHRGLACVQCHVAPQVPRILDCTGCHAHNPALLRQQHRGALIAPDANACLSCHPGGSGR